MQFEIPGLSPHDFPKTLIVDLSQRFGGASMRVLSLMKKLPKDRIALAVLRDSPVAMEAEAASLRVITVGTKKTDPRIFFKLLNAIRAECYEVIDTQNIQSKFWGSLAAVFTGSSLISTLNSWYASEHGEKNFKSRFYTTLELRTNYVPIHYIAVSYTVYDALKQAGIKAGQISLIPNAVEIDPAAILANKERLIDKFQLPADAIVCMAVGRLVWAKGFDDLIKAFVLAVRENPRLHCFIAGDGELYDILALQIEKAGLSQCVFLLGHQGHDNVLSLVKESDIFVMPSRTEGTPIALLEAAALERPILASNCGGIPELVEGEVQALLVPSGNIEALASNLLRLADDPELRVRLGKSARQRIQKDFSLSAQVLATHQAYLRACRKSRV